MKLLLILLLLSSRCRTALASCGGWVVDGGQPDVCDGTMRTVGLPPSRALPSRQPGSRRCWRKHTTGHRGRAESYLLPCYRKRTA